MLDWQIKDSKSLAPTVRGEEADKLLAKSVHDDFGDTTRYAIACDGHGWELEIQTILPLSATNDYVSCRYPIMSRGTLQECMAAAEKDNDTPRRPLGEIPY